MNKLIMILFFLGTLQILDCNAQNEPSGMGRMDPEVVAKPSFETTESGLHLTVWIMSIINDASKIDTNDIFSSTSDTDETRAGTHHVMVGIRDAVEGKEITDANVQLEILSPTGKTDIIDLVTMSDQYGSNVPMEEKGEYRLNLSINTADGRTIKTPFSFKVNR